MVDIFCFLQHEFIHLCMQHFTLNLFFLNQKRFIAFLIILMQSLQQNAYFQENPYGTLLKNTSEKLFFVIFGFFFLNLFCKIIFHIQLEAQTGIRNLSPAEFRSPAFPATGWIFGANDRFMVCLPCCRVHKPIATVNVFFLLDTGCKITYLSSKTIGALFRNDECVSETSLRFSIGVSSLECFNFRSSWFHHQNKNNKIFVKGRTEQIFIMKTLKPNFTASYSKIGYKNFNFSKASVRKFYN